MRTIEIHAAAEALLGRTLLRSSVRGILSTTHSEPVIASPDSGAASISCVSNAIKT
jgi:hypothetical protein